MPEEENDPEMVRLWRAHQKLEADWPTLESDPPVIAIHREVPSEIGKYRIERKLGDGAFGEVYKGYDVALKRSVALKRPLVVPPQGDSSFVQEARSASNITSQYVVTIHDVLTEAPSGPWIVSEFVDGDSMRVWFEKSRSLKKRILLFYYVVMGVGAAHAQNVIHRDLKPENVLVGKDGLPRVADFGMAKQLRAETLQTQTQQGSIKGTLQYMAPEQLRGYAEKIDERSDIFALGVILYELLTGTRPFEGEGWYELLKQIDKTAPVHPFLAAVGQSLKEEENGEYISGICLRCIRKDHRQRYQSARELLVDLKRCYENKPPKHFPPDCNEPPKRLPPARRVKSRAASTEEEVSDVPGEPVVTISVPDKKARTVRRWYQRRFLLAGVFSLVLVGCALVVFDWRTTLNILSKGPEKGAAGQNVSRPTANDVEPPAEPQRVDSSPRKNTDDVSSILSEIHRYSLNVEAAGLSETLISDKDGSPSIEYKIRITPNRKQFLERAQKIDKVLSESDRLMGTFQSDGGMRLRQRKPRQFQQSEQNDFWSKVWGRSGLGEWPVFNGMPEEKIEDLVSFEHSLISDTSSQQNNWLSNQGLNDLIDDWKRQAESALETTILLLLVNANETNKHTTWKWFTLTKDEAKSWFPKKADAAIRCTVKFTDREKGRIAESPFMFDHGDDLYLEDVYEDRRWRPLRVVVLSPYFFIYGGDAYFWDVLVTQRLDGLSTNEVQEITKFSVVRE